MHNEKHFPIKDEQKEKIESQIQDCLEELAVLREDVYKKVDPEFRAQWNEVEKAAHGKTFGWSREVILISLQTLIQELHKVENIH